MLSNDERISWSILTGHKNIKLVKLFFTFTKEPPLITIRSKEKKAANPTSAPHGEFGPKVAVPNNFINKVTEISPSTQRNLQEKSTQTAVESVVKSIEMEGGDIQAKRNHAIQSKVSSCGFVRVLGLR